MITYKYKNGYIHENFLSGIIKIQIGYDLVQVKSIHAGKCLITRLGK